MGASVSSAWGCMKKKPSLYASGGKVNHSLDGTKSRKKADSKIVSRSLGKKCEIWQTLVQVVQMVAYSKRPRDPPA